MLKLVNENRQRAGKIAEYGLEEVVKKLHKEGLGTRVIADRINEMLRERGIDDAVSHQSVCVWLRRRATEHSASAAYTVKSTLADDVLEDVDLVKEIQAYLLREFRRTDQGYNEKRWLIKDLLAVIALKLRFSGALDPEPEHRRLVEPIDLTPYMRRRPGEGYDVLSDEPMSRHRIEKLAEKMREDDDSR